MASGNTEKRMKHIWLILILSAAVLGWNVFAGGEAFAADRQIEWGRYQNSETNNGVIGDVRTPETYLETALKWERQMVSGYTISFTPPLIIDGSLYTASNSYVFKVDKKDGEIRRQSAKLKLNVGYAMNPITYDEQYDQLYVPILRGRVQCLDAETLESKWISKEYPYTQTLSPISCKDGLVYTGIWETETDDGVYLCLDAETGEEVWTYRPSEHGDEKRGFYWAGAYVNDDFVVVGSDDGKANTFAEATEGAYPQSAVVYCFDRRTGAVVDRITGVKGDIRSTVVYDNGHIYFVSKGGRLYKTTLSSDGKFSNTSFIQMKERKLKNGHFVNGTQDALMTSTPVIYKGRIYVGAAGSGGQFSADGGHCFAVVSDDEVLSQDSLIYTVPISGYPQAAPLLSTATEAIDGKVRLYFTFNAFPGGIYCLEDSAEATEDSHENAHLLFRPEKNLQQYCISPLCCDSEGTLYYKNDSGHLMAVTTNEAYLEGIEVEAAGGTVSWDQPFDSGLRSYALQAPNGTESVKVRLNIPDGMTATVQGEPYTKAVTVSLKEDAIAIPVAVSKNAGEKSYTRTYMLNIGTASNNANLAGMTINASNTRPQIVDTDSVKTGNIGVGYDPSFDSEITDYVSRTYSGDWEFLNIWLQTSDPDATVRVIPVSNVGNSAPNYNMNEDGTLSPVGKFRYPVYFVQGESTAEVDIEVTAPSGKVKKTYHVTLVRGEDYINNGMQPLKVSPASVTLYTKGKECRVQITASYSKQDVTGQCTWGSTDTAVARVDEEGVIDATGQGEAEIWASYKADNIRVRARVHVEVVDPTLDVPVSSIEPGTYTEPLEIALQAPAAGADVRYVMGGADEDLAAPSSTGGTLYTEPIRIGEPGQVTSVKIRAIACGDGYKKSYPEDFVYTVDLTDEAAEQAPGVALSPGSICLTDADLKKFEALANGTSGEEITKMLGSVKAQVSMNEAYIAAGGESEIAADVLWNTEEGYDYDPLDKGMQKFVIRGDVQLPEGVSSCGRSLKVFLPVCVEQTRPDAVSRMTAAVNATAKKISVSFPAAAGASYYKIAYRKAGGAWKYKTMSGTSGVITGLAAGGCYEVKAAAINSAGQGGYSPSSLCMIGKTTLKLTKGKKSFKVKMKKVKGAGGYQVRYSLKKTMAGAKTKTTKKVKLTVKKLKKKKVYYVQAAPFKKVGGKTYVGQSVSKKIRTK